MSDDIAALMREAETYVRPCGDSELADSLIAAAASLESAEPVAFQFGARQQYVANHWPPENPDAPGVSPLYRHPPAAVPAGWIPVTEKLPADEELVMVFIPGEDGGIDFDFIEEGVWSNHEDNYQHFMSVGGYSMGGEDCSVTGPSAEAPYTHWMPLPASPEVQS